MAINIFNRSSKLISEAFQDRGPLVSYVHISESSLNQWDAGGNIWPIPKCNQSKVCVYLWMVCQKGMIMQSTQTPCVSTQGLLKKQLIYLKNIEKQWIKHRSLLKIQQGPMLYPLLVPTASIAWGLILSGTISICRMSVVCRLSSVCS